MSEREWTEEQIARTAWVIRKFKEERGNFSKLGKLVDQTLGKFMTELEEQLMASRNWSDISDQHSGKTGSENKIVPIAVEPYRDDNGQRYTKVTFPPPHVAPMCVSADAIFKGVIDCPSSLASCMVWPFIRPWLQNDQEALDLFWKKYDKPDKAEARLEACHSNKYEAWKRERTLLEMIPNYRTWQSNSEKGDSQAGMFAAIQKSQFVEWLLHAVHHDPEALTRLHDLIMDPTSSHGEKGGPYSENGSVFNAFARLVGEYERLPTKAAVRSEAGLASDGGGRVGAARAFKALGLSGLPKAS